MHWSRKQFSRLYATFPEIFPKPLFNSPFFSTFPEFQTSDHSVWLYLYDREFMLPHLLHKWLNCCGSFSITHKHNTKSVKSNGWLILIPENWHDKWPECSKYTLYINANVKTWLFSRLRNIHIHIYAHTVLSVVNSNCVQSTEVTKKAPFFISSEGLSD